MKTLRTIIACAGLLLAAAPGAISQAYSDLPELQKVPAVTGHEGALSALLMRNLADFSPKTDNLGNIYVTVGSGAPHRLIATSIDEPGYVVSELAENGFLRVQRLPQSPPNPVFDSLEFAQPVWVITRTGKQIPGVFAGLSVHLQPGRANGPKMNHVEDLYVDIGASNVAELRAAGVDLLDPVALQRTKFTIGNSGWAGPATGDRFGCAALLQLLGQIKVSLAKGTTTIAFVTEQCIGGRGLNRLLTEIHPDELLFVGRIAPVPSADKETKVTGAKPGSGVVMGIPADARAPAKALAAELKALAEKEQLPLQSVNAAPPRIASYAASAALPERTVQLGVPALWPVTPGEFVDWNDTGHLERLLEAYLDIVKPTGGIGGDYGGGHELTLLEALVESYGASRHEEAVRKVILTQLPPWAKQRVAQDAAGNLVLHLGDGKTKTPRIAFVAHMDELGYEVKKIEEDGRLQVEVLGGGYPQYFLGHVALVHEKDGKTVGAVMELPDGWDKSGSELPNSMKSMDEPVHAYVGTRSREETEKLGIAVGDYLTIPKEYHPLLGTRANARSFDDRVGCAALIAAVHALGPDLPGRDVTFVWSTREETGLEGAAEFAEQAAKENRVPDFVFAIDTFVSSDSPLESKRFGDAEIGKGFVIRAVDNSNIAPLQYVDRVIALARENAIPVQYGVTGGGNDGSVFTRYGSVDIPLGWPLRYSHSPAEVIDTNDLDALGKIVEVLARKW